MLYCGTLSGEQTAVNVENIGLVWGFNVTYTQEIGLQLVIGGKL